MIENYDPNKAQSFDYEHVLKLTFGQWGYKAEFIATAKGNVTGMDCLGSALYDVLHQLPDTYPGVEDSPLTMVMTNPAGEKLTNDDIMFDEDELRGMLIAAEIIELRKVEKQ